MLLKDIDKMMDEYLHWVHLVVLFSSSRGIHPLNFKSLAYAALYFGDMKLLEDLEKWLKDKPELNNWKKFLGAFYYEESSYIDVRTNNDEEMKKMKSEKDI